MDFSLGFLLGIISIVWLAGLTSYIYRSLSSVGRLTRNGKADSIITLLEDVAKKEKDIESALANLHEKYVKLEEEGRLHIQKVGLLRYNPFNDTGGDQSFVLALVDAENTGVIISSLHTRSGTRWYAKGVVKGDGVEHELSEEEKKALKGAKLLKTE